MAGEMAATTRSLQLNVRMDGELKKSGDRVLRLAGYSPSEAVRQLWGVAVQYASEPETLTRLLSGGQASPDMRPSQNPTLLKLRQGRELMAQARRELGIEGEVSKHEESYDDMREAYLCERLEERGLA